MKLLKKLLVILSIFCLLSSTAFSAANLGEQLVKKLFNDLATGNMAALDREISSGFQGVSLGRIQDKIVFMNNDKMGELAALKHIKTAGYSLSGFRTTREGPSMVVTYWVDTPRKISNGKVISRKTMRLLCFVQTDEGWKAIAYANFMPRRQ